VQYAVLFVDTLRCETVTAVSQQTSPQLAAVDSPAQPQRTDSQSTPTPESASRQPSSSTGKASAESRTALDAGLVILTTDNDNKAQCSEDQTTSEVAEVRDDQ